MIGTGCLLSAGGCGPSPLEHDLHSKGPAEILVPHLEDDAHGTAANFAPNRVSASSRGMRPEFSQADLGPGGTGVVGIFLGVHSVAIT